MRKLNRLSKLPNIGKALELKLHRVDIKTPEELRSLGSKKAFERIRDIDNSVCINMLYALEGAIQSIRWHNLLPDEKEELKEYFRSIDKD